MRAEAVRRTSSRRRAHWLQAVSPSSVAWSSQQRMESLAREGSGATAAWSKYATRAAIGIAARKRVTMSASAVLSAESVRTKWFARLVGKAVTVGASELYWGSEQRVLRHA